MRGVAFGIKYCVFESILVLLITGIDPPDEILPAGCGKVTLEEFAEMQR